jgi:hypothetical protein
VAIFLSLRFCAETFVNFSMELHRQTFVPGLLLPVESWRADGVTAGSP